MSGPTIQIVPGIDPANAPLNSDSIVLEQFRPVKQVGSGKIPGVLYGFSGYHAGPAQFIQVHDSATAPVNGAVPKIVIPVTIGSTSQVPFSIDFGAYGRGFNNGIYICNSTTGPTLTAGAADCWFNARYK